MPSIKQTKSPHCLSDRLNIYLLISPSRRQTRLHFPIINLAKAALAPIFRVTPVYSHPIDVSLPRWRVSSPEGGSTLALFTGESIRLSCWTRFVMNPLPVIQEEIISVSSAKEGSHRKETPDCLTQVKKGRMSAEQSFSKGCPQTSRLGITQRFSRNTYFSSITNPRNQKPADGVQQPEC